MSDIIELQQGILELFGRLNVEVPSPDTDLFETGLLDSLTFVEFLVQLEDQMGVVVTLENLEPHNFRSIQHIASFVLAERQCGAGFSRRTVAR